GGRPAARRPEDGASGRPADRGRRATRLCRRGRPGRRGRRPGSGPDGDRRRERLMAVAQAAGRLAAPTPRHWWRGRASVVAAVVLAMLAAYLVWKSELAWPSSLVWKSLAGYLDRVQTWLSDNRNVAHPNFAIA